MPTEDPPAIRKDVLRVIARTSEIQMEGVSRFLSLDENRGVDFRAILKKIGAGNREYLKIAAGKENSITQLRGVLSFEETVFMARLFRYAEEYLTDANLGKSPISGDVKVETARIDGVAAEWQTVPEAAVNRVLLYFHGGGQILGSARTHRQFTVELARAIGSRVLSVEYRLAPEHPFPMGLQDCLSSYKWLLKQGIDPQNVIVGGDSAGGNQALATLLKLRDERMPLPAGGFALSPAIDYTFESKTRLSNRQTDSLSNVATFWWDLAYLGDADPYHPYVSPVHADLHGLPPLLLQVSASEILYDHSTRFVKRAREAGVSTALQEWTDMVHAWQYYGLYELPEAKEAMDNIGEFVHTLF